MGATASCPFPCPSPARQRLRPEPVTLTATGNTCGLRCRIFRMAPLVGMMEGENDVLARNARVDEFVSHAVLGAVVLDPYLAVTNIDVQDGPMDTPPLFPSNIEQLVMTALVVKDRLGLD